MDASGAWPNKLVSSLTCLPPLWVSLRADLGSVSHSARPHCFFTHPRISRLLGRPQRCRAGLRNPHHNVPGPSPTMPGFIHLSASFPPSFSVLCVILPSEVGGEHQLSLLSDSLDLDMRTTGMCVLLVCLCTVSPGQGTTASQDEYVESLSEKTKYETAAVNPPGITALSVNADDSSSSLSLGKISFLSFFNVPLQKQNKTNKQTKKVLKINLLLGQVLKNCIYNFHFHTKGIMLTFNT